MGKKETTRVRRTFTPQFKRDAVQLVNEGKTVSEVARDLGIARERVGFLLATLAVE